MKFAHLFIYTLIRYFLFSFAMVGIGYLLFTKTDLTDWLFRGAPYGSLTETFGMILVLALIIFLPTIFLMKILTRIVLFLFPKLTPPSYQEAINSLNK